MRVFTVALSTVVLCVGTAVAQTGFTSQTYSAPKSSQIVSADLNGDGKPDLLVWYNSYGSGGTPSIFFNNGQGGFNAPVSLPSSGGAFTTVAVADMNGDNFPDIVGCYTTTTSGAAQMNIVVELNNGSGTFTPKPTVTQPGSCAQLTIGDVFHNGHPAVVTAGSVSTSRSTTTNYVDVFSNDGTGTLTLASSQSPNLDSPTGKPDSYTNCGLTGVVGGDFKKNGSFDLVLYTNCDPPQVQPYEPFGSTLFYASDGPASSPGYSTFTFQLTNQYQLEYASLADINNDGYPDILFYAVGLGYGGGNPNTVEYGKNDGYGNFTVQTFANVLVAGGWVGVGDFNGDGYNDLAVTSGYVNSGQNQAPTLTIYAGAADGSYTQSSQAVIGSSTAQPGPVVATDFNGDGKIDIATLVPDTGTQTTALLVDLNNQNGASSGCSAPSTANTNVICSPANGATLTSGSVNVTAASNVTNYVHNRLYLDNQDVWDQDYGQQTVNTVLSVGNGTHTLVLVTYDSAGHAYTSSTTFSVGSGTSNGCIPGTAGVTICSPATGATVTTQTITVTAGAKAQTGYLTAMRVYVDNVAMYTINTSGAPATFQFTQTIPVNAGTHNVVVVAYESTGQALTNSVSVTSSPGPCTPGTSNGVKICSPSPSFTAGNPVVVSAGAISNTSTIAAIRIYVDNVAVATVNNAGGTYGAFSIQQAVTMSSGSHNLVVVGYPSSGGYVSALETVNVQ